ncbi:lipase family protein [Campylobacter coli]|uniref:lipase family protein n=1 Tax=Campylobacter coli TaxID=195 RepID=UPI000AFC2AB3|nr:Mbeg1-like protein [Campylobacter coli]UKW12444.1 DUF2974 domain-containing protein [Campylobacter coli]
MANKELINKLRDMAELAQASYGYFDLVTHDKNDFFIKIKDETTESAFFNKHITQANVLDISHKNYKAYQYDSSLKKDIKIGTLNGDFSPLQAKQFFSRYDLLKHCPNTDSGFSATLFGEKRKQIDSKTKEKSYTSEYGYINYILAIRGTEMSSFKDLFVADASLAIGSISKAQYDDMINFYETCIKDYPQIKEKDSLTITGHSLGGCLAQLFALSICDDKNRNNIKALYTYNTPGARKIAPPYDYIVKLFICHSKEQQERFIKEEIENIANRARDLAKIIFS